MEESPKKRRFTIKLIDRGAPHGDEFSLSDYKTEASADDLGELLLRIILSHVSIRPEVTLAGLVRSLFEGTGDTLEYWPGYNVAMDRFVNAACEVVDGWDRFDAERRKA